ncbi:MAG TPA: hypothetical protein VM388_00835 [Acidimicrobiales bacterium]|nr:hypothetical protein [Acidimicrobiales bacterium]
MNPPTVVQPDSARRTSRRLGVGLAAVVFGLAAVLVLTYLVGLSSGPATVARITFQNPTAYALDIEVSSGPDSGWTSAGSVRQRSTAEVTEVVDQGDVWVFRFDSQGATGGELRLSRTELEAAGWRVSIPAEVGNRLAAAGAPPTP